MAKRTPKQNVTGTHTIADPMLTVTITIMFGLNAESRLLSQATLAPEGIGELVDNVQRHAHELQPLIDVLTDAALLASGDVHQSDVAPSDPPLHFSQPRKIGRA